MNANHHLWRNRHYWWVAFSVTFDGYRQERIRRSLGTRDVHEARRRRDRLMHQYRGRPGCRLSIRGGPALLVADAQKVRDIPIAGARHRHVAARPHFEEVGDV